MKSWFELALAAVFSVGFLVSEAQAQESGTREEAKAMVLAAVEYVEKVGAEQAFKDFTDKANKNWQKNDLYVFAYTMDGVNVAHGANAKLIGKNLIEMRDPEGKLLIKELRDTAARGGGWVEYEWPHPQTKKVESKVSYVKMMISFRGFIGVGVYR